MKWNEFFDKVDAGNPVETIELNVIGLAVIAVVLAFNFLFILKCPKCNSWKVINDGKGGHICFSCTHFF